MTGVRVSRTSCPPSRLVSSASVPYVRRGLPRQLNSRLAQHGLEAQLGSQESSRNGYTRPYGRWLQMGKRCASCSEMVRRSLPSAATSLRTAAGHDADCRCDGRSRRRMPHRTHAVASCAARAWTSCIPFAGRSGGPTRIPRSGRGLPPGEEDKVLDTYSIPSGNNSRGCVSRSHLSSCSGEMDSLLQIDSGVRPASSSSSACWRTSSMIRASQVRVFWSREGYDRTVENLG